MTTLILKGIFLAGLFVITIALGRKRYLKGLQFTCWILCGITAGLCFPEYLLHWGPINLRDKALLLFIVQAVMFGMGTQLRLGDFAGLKRMRFALAIGMLGQFTIMPLMGFALTHLFQFEPEIAAGLILMGSCSSGLASNVMAYLAGANLALSITMTACATLLAPIVTPLWMKLLAGELITVDAWGMMQQIISIVLIPISAALWPEAWKNAGKSGKYLLRLGATSGFIWHLASVCLPAWHSLILEHWGIKILGFNHPRVAHSQRVDADYFHVWHPLFHCCHNGCRSETTPADRSLATLSCHLTQPRRLYFWLWPGSRMPTG